MTEGGREESASLWTLLVCQAALVTGLALSFPFFALYLNRERGLPMGLVGLALAGMLVAAGVAQAWGGELSDLVGAKAVMEFALLSRGALCLALAWAIKVRASVPTLVALLIAAGFFGNFFEPGIRSWIADHFSALRRRTLYSYQRIAVNLGWGIGPAIGGFMARTSYPLMFAVTAALCAGSFVLMRARLPAHAPARSGQRFEAFNVAEAARDGRFLEFCLYTMAVATVMGQFVASLSIYAVGVIGLTESQVGWLFALNGGLVTVIQARVTRGMLGRRLTLALAAGCLLYAAGYGFVGFSRGFAALAASVVVLTLGEALTTPSLHAIAANLAPAHLRGRYVGLHGLSLHIGAALAPLLGGLALERLSPRWAAGPWVLVAALGAGAGLCFARFSRRLNDEEQGIAAPWEPIAEGA
jgi:MFS family permease